MLPLNASTARQESSALPGGYGGLHPLEMLRQERSLIVGRIQPPGAPLSRVAW